MPQPLTVQRFRSSSALSAMAKAPEDMTFEDLEGVVAGYCCRALNVPFVSGAVPLGAWNHVNFPMTDVDEHDGNPANMFSSIDRLAAFLLRNPPDSDDESEDLQPPLKRTRR